MRFIPAKSLKPGQILGVDLVFDKNRVLLRRGVALTEKQIDKINYLGFQGVYIEDNLSRDIYVENIISEELRMRAQKDVRDLFLAVESDSSSSRVHHTVTALNPVIEKIVDEIIYNKALMVNVIDIRAYDDYTYSHSINVTVLSVMLGLVMGMTRSQLNELAMGGLVHDIGKVFIDKRIINKDSKLTFEEFEEVKRHSLAGYNYLSSSKALPDSSKEAVLAHHEQFNGTGYPAGLSGEKVPLFSRIISLVDVFDALISDRPYRHAMLPSDAVEYIMSGYNTMFDPMVVDAFVRKVAPYPIGSCVRLSDDRLAIVVENFESRGMRPKVRIIEKGEVSEEYIDLAHDYSALCLTIRDIAEI